jgi:formylglycine-generating enzyme required for sulfatase activity
MNVFQGSFPAHDTGADGYVGTAPVDAFPANGFGLHNVTGNVWEWCADWYDEGYYSRSPRASPAGPESGTERVMRGGSWMCSENHCSNFRPGARSHATPDTGLNNVGFRLVRDAAPE